MSGPSAESNTAERLARALGPGYEVRPLVGRGGFAEVYEVWDRELERRLAVKVVRPDVAWTDGILKRFKQETRTVARLQHPNILPIHFVGEGEGLVYYAMPYVEGESLGDLLRSRGALPADHAVSIALPILDALQHAHAAGLVHRDIKPDNVMLDRVSGRPLLVDFGIAKRLDAEAGLTQAGFVVGTPHYMSPEQALGEANLDARSDLYSFGAVLFQMVTGAPPFDGDSSQEIVGKHLAEPPPLPAVVNAHVPGWLSAAIVRCLEKKPGDRFQSVAMLVDALRVGAAQGVPTADTTAATEVLPSTERRRAATPPRRGRWMALVVVLAVAALAGWRVTRPRLVFENALAVPVTLSIGGREHVVASGARVRIPLSRRAPPAALWTAQRPAAPDGLPMGAELHGAVQLRERRVSAAARAVTGDAAFFAPLITNATGRPLRVTVNVGSAAAMDCACTVPPGTVRMSIGYYPLFRNSSVRVTDAQHRSATFTDLGPNVDRVSGVVGLRFTAADLR
ncbi:MAG: serine/threonine protein kinase [Gemmatimonadota bacterium]|nr:serine/threonine protein kinase [Gemmatimonadota bacterium]MDH4352344.1 serine/threonine protein kinase [Gemmatimonadota bacterium]MDH5197441.1 serine/threonine protein kinase [Gemmatimonadota bacterium]